MISLADWAFLVEHQMIGSESVVGLVGMTDRIGLGLKTHAAVDSMSLVQLTGLQKVDSESIGLANRFEFELKLHTVADMKPLE